MGATDGKEGNVYIRKENGHVGSGLDDLNWGVFSSASDSSYFEVEIDTEDTPDTFRWRENGGAWTEDVAITGAAQTLAGANGDQIITFSATTGHTLGDKWVIGNLYAEACTLTGNTARITDASMRILNPAGLPTFTPTNPVNRLRIDAARGEAVFDGPPGATTAAGTDGFVPAPALEKIGYLYDWSLDVTTKLDEITSFGDDWQTFIDGLSGGSGSASGYYSTDAWRAAMASSVEEFLLMLFTYDPDQDATGDHFVCWAGFTDYNVNADGGAVVSDKIGFTLYGAPDFVPNT